MGHYLVFSLSTFPIHTRVRKLHTLAHARALPSSFPVALPFVLRYDPGFGEALRDIQKTAARETMGASVCTDSTVYRAFCYERFKRSTMGLSRHICRGVATLVL